PIAIASALSSISRPLSVYNSSRTSSPSNRITPAATSSLLAPPLPPIYFLTRLATISSLSSTEEPNDPSAISIADHAPKTSCVDGLLPPLMNVSRAMTCTRRCSSRASVSSHRTYSYRCAPVGPASGTTCATQIRRGVPFLISTSATPGDADMASDSLAIYSHLLVVSPPNPFSPTNHWKHIAADHFLPV